MRRDILAELYFNPRLREGGDWDIISLCPLWLISIHASAKEATHHSYSHIVSCQISIHASAKEATTKGEYFFLKDSNFNPRLREGGDRKGE